MRKILSTKLFKNTAWTAGGNGLMAAISFFSSIFVVRNLGPAEYGILQEMTAYFAVILNIENMLNPNVFKKRLLEHPEESDDIVFTFGAAIGITGLVLSALVTASYFIFGLPQKFLILSLLLFGMIFRFSNGISFYFDAHLESVKGQISLNVGNTISSAYKVLMSFLSPIALLQAVAVPIQYFCTAFVHLYQYSRRPNKAGLTKLRIHKLFLMVTTSLPLFFSSFVDLFKDRFPIMFLGRVATPSDLGFYGAGVKLTEPWLFVASALTISFWPKLVHSKKEGPPFYERALTLYFASVLYIFLSVALSGFFLSGFLIHNVLGPKYSGSLGVFQIQTFALVAQSLSATFAIVEINEGLTKISLIRNFASLIICIVALYLLVPLYHIEGASIAVLIANTFSCLIFPLFVYRIRWIWVCLVKSPFKFWGLVRQKMKE